MPFSEPSQRGVGIQKSPTFASTTTDDSRDSSSSIEREGRDTDLTSDDEPPQDTAKVRRVILREDDDIDNLYAIHKAGKPLRACPHGLNTYREGNGKIHNANADQNCQPCALVFVKQLEASTDQACRHNQPRDNLARSTPTFTPRTPRGSLKFLDKTDPSAASAISTLGQRLGQDPARHGDLSVQSNNGLGCTGWALSPPRIKRSITTKSSADDQGKDALEPTVQPVKNTMHDFAHLGAKFGPKASSRRSKPRHSSDDLPLTLPPSSVEASAALKDSSEDQRIRGSGHHVPSIVVRRSNENESDSVEELMTSVKRLRLSTEFPWRSTDRPCCETARPVSNLVAVADQFELTAPASDGLVTAVVESSSPVINYSGTLRAGTPTASTPRYIPDYHAILLGSASNASSAVSPSSDYGYCASPLADPSAIPGYLLQPYHRSRANQSRCPQTDGRQPNSSSSSSSGPSRPRNPAFGPPSQSQHAGDDGDDDASDPIEDLDQQISDTELPHELVDCPVRKHNPRLNNCMGGFPTVSRAREHMMRRHDINWGCRDCFRDHKDGSRSCGRPKRVVDRELFDLSDLPPVSHRGTIEEKWDGLYNAIFPNDRQGVTHCWYEPFLASLYRPPHRRGQQQQHFLSPSPPPAVVPSSSGRGSHSLYLANLNGWTTPSNRSHGSGTSGHVSGDSSTNSNNVFTPISNHSDLPASATRYAESYGPTQERDEEKIARLEEENARLRLLCQSWPYEVIRNDFERSVQEVEQAILGNVRQLWNSGQAIPVADNLYQAWYNFRGAINRLRQSSGERMQYIIGH